MSRNLNLDILVEKKGWSFKGMLSGMMEKIGYDGCGTHTHAGSLTLSEISQAFSDELTSISNEDLINTQVIMRPTNTYFNDLDLPFPTAYYVTVEAGLTGCIYKSYEGKSSQDAQTEANNLLSSVQAEANQRSVSLISNSVITASQAC